MLNYYYFNYSSCFGSTILDPTDPVSNVSKLDNLSISYNNYKKIILITIAFKKIELINFHTVLIASLYSCSACIITASFISDICFSLIPILFSSIDSARVFIFNRSSRFLASITFSLLVSRSNNFIKKKNMNN